MVSIPSRDFFPSDGYATTSYKKHGALFQSLPGISFLLTWRARMEDETYGVSIPSRDFFPSDFTAVSEVACEEVPVSIPSRDFFPSDNFKKTFCTAKWCESFNPFQGFLSFWLLVRHFLWEEGWPRFQSLPGISFLLTLGSFSPPEIFLWFQSLPGISFLLTGRVPPSRWGDGLQFQSLPGISFLLTAENYIQTPDSNGVSIPSRDFFPSDTPLTVGIPNFSRSFNPFQGFLSFWRYNDMTL